MILAPHTGRRRKPSLRRRLTARWHARRTRKAIEAARDEAYAERIKPRKPSQLATMQIKADVLTAVASAATGPLPAAMADVDGDRPWEFPTGQWPAFMDSIEGEQ